MIEVGDISRAHNFDQISLQHAAAGSFTIKTLTFLQNLNLFQL